MKKRVNDLLAEVKRRTGLPKGKIMDVIEAIGDIARRQLSEESLGFFIFPKIMKIIAKYKPARPACVRPNPWKKGEEMNVKARPKKAIFKIVPLTKLRNLS